MNGTQTEYLAQRLAQQHPEQYQRVKAGELSINAAAVLAGIRPRRVSVSVDDPEAAARSLRRNMSAEALAALAASLAAE